MSDIRVKMAELINDILTRKSEEFNLQWQWSVLLRGGWGKPASAGTELHPGEPYLHHQPDVSPVGQAVYLLRSGVPTLKHEYACGHFSRV